MGRNPGEFTNDTLVFEIPSRSKHSPGQASHALPSPATGTRTGSQDGRVGLPVQAAPDQRVKFNARRLAATAQERRAAEKTALFGASPTQPPYNALPPSAGLGPAGMTRGGCATGEGAGGKEFPRSGVVFGDPEHPPHAAPPLLTLGASSTQHFTSTEGPPCGMSPHHERLQVPLGRLD